MGLFDGLFGEKSSGQGQELSKGEAYFGILLCAVASDGNIAEEEFRTLVTMVQRMRLYENWSGQKFQSTHNRMIGLIKRQGVEKVMRKCADALPNQLHETAFASAVDLVLADGVVEPEEKEFIESLQKALHVSGDQALTIVEVMTIKNKA